MRSLKQGVSKGESESVGREEGGRRKEEGLEGEVVRPRVAVRTLKAWPRSVVPFYGNSGPAYCTRRS